MAPLRTLALVFCAIPVAGAAEPSTLSTLDGKSAKGDVVSIDGKELVFKTASGEERYELTKLSVVEVGKAAPPASGAKFITVELIDGSLFYCSDFKVKGKTAALTLLGSDRTVAVPSSSLLYMVRDISDPKLNQDFRRALATRGKRDVWIVPKGVKVEEKIESLDSVPGTFGDGNESGDSVKFEIASNGNTVDIQTSRIYGMVFNQAQEAKVSQTVCKVVDAQGNTVVAAAVAYEPGKPVAVETVTGVKFEYSELGKIARLDFGAGALQYLSNIDPVRVDLSSTEGVAEPYRRDRNLDNDDLRIAGQKYPKGLALHSRTVLVYDLKGQYKVFEALAGVDDCVEGESKVTLTIEGDSAKPLFKDVIKKGDKPRPLTLPVLNVKQLTITVESDFLDLGNQVDLAGAKVRK
jgi:hypothetical protein